MDVQLQRGRSPPVLRAHIVALELIAGMVSGKDGIPVVNVVSVMLCVRIVIH